jgi:predicted trehalose synthase
MNMLERSTSSGYDVHGGYFMSDEQQDAVIGRVLRELKEAKQKLARLRAEADRIGQALGRIGQTLVSNPQSLVFASGSINVPTHEELASLTNDIRNTMQEVDRLKQQASDLGFPDRSTPGHP